MATSMTGFGQVSYSDREMTADVAVRTVNGKGLKTRVLLGGLHMPGLVEHVEQLVAQRVERGSVDVSIRLDWSGVGYAAFNERVIESYVKELEQLRLKLGLAAHIEIDRIAQLPGAMVSDGMSSTAAEHVWRKLRPVVSEAIDKAIRMRGVEGRALAAGLKKSCAQIKKLVAQIERRTTKGLDEYRKRLTDRVSALVEQSGSKFDESMIARETIFYSERSNIAEEILRMKAHITHFLDTLGGDIVGRKLEFIAQEMHREANTMASKSADPAMTELVIDLRGEVDHLREQVLNLE